MITGFSGICVHFISGWSRSKCTIHRRSPLRASVGRADARSRAADVEGTIALNTIESIAATNARGATHDTFRDAPRRARGARGDASRAFGRGARRASHARARDDDECGGCMLGADRTRVPSLDESRLITPHIMARVHPLARAARASSTLSRANALSRPPMTRSRRAFARSTSRGIREGGFARARARRRR